MTSVKTIMGVFTEHDDVALAIKSLQKEGYSPKDISLVMKDHESSKAIAHHTGATVGTTAASGAATGAALGGLTGLLVGLGVLALPGLGAFLIGGPLAAALGLTGAAASTATGAITGAVAGGLVGALTGLGLSQGEAEHYERRIQEGAILLVVPAYTGQEAEVERILNRYNATDIRSINVSTTVKLDEQSTDARHEETTQAALAHPREQHREDDQVSESTYTQADTRDDVDVRRYLQHIDYPASKHQLVREAKDEGADANIIHMLDELPDKKFENSTSVNRALSSMH